ncbi:hypothetical protein BBFL7_01377 [Flavobacteria bacterium BBFL7]|nr:hypothetical protein BBFL7_01377 [Flavobacteria bacterium BBFL7]
MKKAALLLLLLGLCVFSNAQIIVDNTTYTNTELIEDVLVNSTCAGVRNIAWSTGAAANQNGIAYFQHNSSGFPIREGIILSTGHAPNAVGPNYVNGIEEPTLSDQLGTASDSDLDNALAGSTPAVNSTDVTWMSFDFVPQAGFMSFEFLFASEEYDGGFECTFSDAFAFLLTDTVTNTTTNLAVLPGTTEPIRVTNIHPAVPGSCLAINEQYFDRYNILPQGSTSPTQFNGRTVVLRAQSSVVAGRNYTIKLVIGDSDQSSPPSDRIYDSAVFIAGGSFDIGADLGLDRTLVGANPLCEGDQYTLDASVAGAAMSYQWNRNAAPIPGATNATYTATTTGNYSVDINYTASCSTIASVFLEFISPNSSTPTDMQACGTGGTAVFDLTSKTPEALGALAAADHTVSYYESQSDAEAGINPIPNPSTYSNTANPQTVYVRVEENAFNCASVEEFDLTIATITSGTPMDMIACDVDNDGFFDFDLSTQDADMAGTNAAGSVTVTYHLSQVDADAGVNPVGPTYTNTTTPETIYGRVELNTDSNCADTASFNLILNPSPVAPTITDFEACSTIDPNTTVFALSDKDTEIMNGQANVLVSYYSTQADADIGVNELPTNGYTNTSNPQTIYVRLIDALTNCVNTDTTFELVVNDLPVVTAPALYDLCDDNTIDGFTSFDLATRDSEITGGNTSYTVFYYATQLDADNRMNELTGSYTNTVNPQTVFVVVEDNVTGCENYTTLNLEVIDAPQAATAPDLILCDDNNTGDLTETFNLTDNEATVLNGQTGITLTYHNSQADADAGSNAIGSPTSFDNSSSLQTVYVRVENTTGCFNTTSFNIIVNEVPVPQMFDLYYLCLDANGNVLNTDNSPPTLDTTLSATGLSFSWSLDGNVLPAETGATLTATMVGMYTVTATDTTTGCNSSQTTEVRQLGPPDSFGAEVTSRYFDEVHRIEAFAQGPATQYIFSVDDGPWQYNGFFEDVTPGPHVVFIQDLDGCNTVEIPIDVIGYPRYFTPNNDGYHDTWNIIGINNEPTTKIYIFDRYGKLLKQMNPSGIGWDGFYNGQPLPSSDYWFQVEYIENGSNKTFGGHFALKR